MKFSKSGIPLLASQAENVKVEVLKRGPLFVVLRYSGQIRLSGDQGKPEGLPPPSRVPRLVACPLQDAKEAIAFAIDGFGTTPGTWTISLGGQGHSVVQLVPAKPATHHELAIYEHFVATPVPIGAVTSPVSMLSPLIVTILKSGK